MGGIFSTDSDANATGSGLLPTIVCIEGNIGSGKTTILNKLQNDGHLVVREDVDKWVFLGLRYKDPVRWSCTLQAEISLSIHNMLKTAVKTALDNNTPVIFVERSIFSCLLFSKVILDRGGMGQNEFGLLSSMTSTLASPFKQFKTKCIMLECSVEECMRRIKNRERICNNTTPEKIDIEYLRALEIQFESFKKGNDAIIINSEQKIDDVMECFYSKTRDINSTVCGDGVV